MLSIVFKPNFPVWTPLQVGKASGQRVVFGEDGVALHPLAALAQEAGSGGEGTETGTETGAEDEGGCAAGRWGRGGERGCGRLGPHAGSATCYATCCQEPCELHVRSPLGA